LFQIAELLQRLNSFKKIKALENGIKNKIHTWPFSYCISLFKRSTSSIVNEVKGLWLGLEVI
jgi:hypothetical protein